MKKPRSVFTELDRHERNQSAEYDDSGDENAVRTTTVHEHRTQDRRENERGEINKPDAHQPRQIPQPRALLRDPHHKRVARAGRKVKDQHGLKDLEQEYPLEADRGPNEIKVAERDEETGDW